VAGLMATKVAKLPLPSNVPLPSTVQLVKPDVMFVEVSNWYVHWSRHRRR